MRLGCFHRSSFYLFALLHPAEGKWDWLFFWHSLSRYGSSPSSLYITAHVISLDSCPLVPPGTNFCYFPWKSFTIAATVAGPANVLDSCIVSILFYLRILLCLRIYSEISSAIWSVPWSTHRKILTFVFLHFYFRVSLNDQGHHCSKQYQSQNQITFWLLFFFFNATPWAQVTTISSWIIAIPPNWSLFLLFLDINNLFSTGLPK